MFVGSSEHKSNRERMSIYSLSGLPTLAGGTADLSALEGKPVLVVNVASC